ncbi:MAG: MarR family transcriptional regulator [Armatimonadota bacterium]|nr:MarR family transcriptional regulator [Armatimonadota bacterium]MDR5696967.1 MarR family transcriptional regulator [Armatimonadota bacterium]
MAVSEASDLESRLHTDDHRAVRLWLRLLTCTNLITAEIRRRLRRRFGTTLPRFDLLAQLERNPRGLRMGELSRRMMVTTGNVTALVDRLEAEGWIRRRADPQDRRSVLVHLTPAGRRAFARMARTHEAWIVELFSDLSGEDIETLHALLGRLKQSVRKREAAH